MNGETTKNLSVWLSCGRFHSLLVAFRNTKTRRYSEIKQTRALWEVKFVCYILRLEDLEEIVEITSLCGVWWCSSTISIACSFPKIKKSFLSVSHLINSAWITQNKHYCGITKRMNFNCSCLWKKWKHIFKWQRLRELNAIGYTFNFLRSSSLICSKQTFTVSSAIMISLPSSVFPSKANGETEKKKLSPLWKISLPSGGIQEHKNRDEVKSGP